MTSACVWHSTAAAAASAWWPSKKRGMSCLSSAPAATAWWSSRAMRATRPRCRRLSIKKAEFVVASCEHDATNVAIAATIGRIVASSPNGRPTLVCRLLLRDPELRPLLENAALFTPRDAPGRSYYVNFHDLNREEAAARQALRFYPLDVRPNGPPIGKDSATRVHLVVVGFGAMGRSLAVQAARVGHFANQKLVRLTVIDQAARASAAQFRRQFAHIGDPQNPRNDDVCELAALEADRSADATLGALKGCLAAGADELVTCAVCLEMESHERGPIPDDRENLRIGLAISRACAENAGADVDLPGHALWFRGPFPSPVQSSGWRPVPPRLRNGRRHFCLGHAPARKRGPIGPRPAPGL